jgi:predicted Zn-dependent peptidase
VPVGGLRPSNDLTVCRRGKLPSGLTVITEHIPTVRSAAVGVWVATGSRDEEPSESGMAHFVEHLLFKGTTARDARRIAMEVDALGGHLDAFTSREYTCFFVSVLDHRVAEGMGLLADIFQNSLFARKDIDLERGVILEEIRMCADNPEDSLHDLTMAQVWGGHPLSRPILGTPGSVGSFKRREVVDFVRKHYHTGGAFLTAAGNITHEGITQLAERLFGTASPGPAALPRTPPSFTPGVVREEKPLQQVYIDLNLPGLPQDHRLRYPGHILNAILGGSLSSRLFQKIREERGLVYSIYSGISSQDDTGLLHVSAGTGPALSRQVIDLIVKELALIRREVPSAEEIRRAKDHLIGNLVLSMESSSNRMHKLGKQELYFGRHVSVEETIAEIETVDEPLLEEASATFFQDGMVSWGFLGPAEGLPSDGELPAW